MADTEHEVLMESVRTPFGYLTYHYERSGDAERAHIVEDEALWEFVAWIREGIPTLEEARIEAARFTSWNEDNENRTKWYV